MTHLQTKGGKENAAQEGLRKAAESKTKSRGIEGAQQQVPSGLCPQRGFSPPPGSHTPLALVAAGAADLG